MAFGASPCSHAAGEWMFEHREAVPTPLGGGTIAHSLIRPAHLAPCHEKKNSKEMLGSNNMAPSISPIREGKRFEREDEYPTQTVYVKLQWCNDLLPILIHNDDFPSTTVEELGNLVTDLMVRRGLYRGQPKTVAKLMYRESEWRLIGRWAGKHALLSELNYQKESIVYAFLSSGERTAGWRAEAAAR